MFLFINSCSIVPCEIPDQVRDDVHQVRDDVEGIIETCANADNYEIYVKMSVFLVTILWI